MGIEPPPDPREPGELFRFIAEVESIYHEDSFKECSDALHMVATAGRFGIVFVATQTSIHAFRTSQIFDKKDKTPIGAISVPGSISRISSNCDGRILLVTVTDVNSKSPFAFLFDIPSVVHKGTNIAPFYSLPLSTQPGTKVTSVSWNPCDPVCVAVAISNGDLCMIRVKESSADFIQKNGIGANAIAWSAKGKQLAVGKSGSTISLFKPDLTPVRDIEAPPIAGVGPVLDITWFTNTEFFVGYQTANNIPNMVYVNAPKGKPATFVNFEDVCYSNESVKPVSYYTIFISEWSLLLVFSSNGVEMGVIGKSQKEVAGGCNWCQWFPDDGARASMHFHNVVEETFPYGLAVDFTSQRTFLAKDETQKGPYPIVYTLSNKGVLNKFYVEDRMTEPSNLCKPPENIPTTGFRIPEQFGRSSVPLGNPPTVGLGPSKPPDPPSQSSSFSMTPNKSEVPVTSAPFSFSTPLKSPFAPSATQKATPPAPFAPSVSSILPASSGTTPSNKPVASNMFSFTPVGSAAPFSPFSKPVSLSSQQPTVPLPAPSPQKSTFQGPAVVQSTSALAAPVAPVAQQPSPAVIQQPISTVVQPSLVAAVQPIAAPFPVAKAPSAPASVPASSPSGPPRPSKETILLHLGKEMTLFEKELKDLLSANDSLVYQVGTEKEDAEIKVILQSASKWVNNVKKCSQEHNAEVEELHQKTLKALSLYEDAKTQMETKNTSRALLYSDLRPLDPYSQRKLDGIKAMYRYLTEEINVANSKLELMWEKHAARSKPRSFPRDYRSQTENLYRVVYNLHKKRLYLEKQLDDMVHKMKKLNIDHLFPSTSTLNISDRSLFNESKLSVHESSLLSASFGTDSSKRSEKLRDILAQRNYTPVRKFATVQRPRAQIKDEIGARPVEANFPVQQSSPVTPKLDMKPKFEVSPKPVYEVISPQPAPASAPTPAPFSANPLAALSSMVGSVLPGSSQASSGHNIQASVAKGVSLGPPSYGQSIKSEVPSPKNTAAITSGSAAAVPGMNFSFASPQTTVKYPPKDVASVPSSSSDFKAFSSANISQSVPGTSAFSFSAPVISQGGSNAPKPNLAGNIFAPSSTSVSAITSKPFSLPSVSGVAPFNLGDGKEKGLTFSATSAFKSVSSQNTPVPVDSTTKTAMSSVSPSVEQYKGMVTPEQTVILTTPTTSISNTSGFSFAPGSSSAAGAVSSGGSFSFGNLSSASSAIFNQPNKSVTSTPSMVPNTSSVEVKSSSAPVSVQPFSNSGQGQTLIGSSPQSSLQSTQSAAFSFSLPTSSQPTSIGKPVAATPSSIFNSQNQPSIFGQQSKSAFSAFGQVPSSAPPTVSSTATMSIASTTSTPQMPMFGQPQSTAPVSNIPVSTAAVTSGFVQQTVSSSSSIFGVKTTTQGGLFGSPAASVPSTATTISADNKLPFGLPASGTSFGTSTPISVSVPSIFSPSNPAAVSGPSMFGASTPSTAASGPSMFGASTPSTAISGTSMFGASTPSSAVSGTSMFGASTPSTAVSGSSVFGSSIPSAAVSGNSMFGASTLSTAVSGSSIFGVSTPSTAASGPPMFGATTPSTAVSGSSVFGASATPASATIVSSSASSMFGGGSPFSSPASQPASAAHSIFGVASTSSSMTTPFTTTGPIFGQASSTTTTSTQSLGIFGQTSTLGTTSTPSVFGSNQSSTAASSVLGTAPVATTAASVLGASYSVAPQFGSATPSSSVFGAQSSPFASSSSGSTSIFGSPSTQAAAPATKSFGIFGAASTPQQSGTVFGGAGATSPFGAPSSASSPFGGGGGFFSGLGSAPSAESASTNVFGAVKTDVKPQTNVFGGGGSGSAAASPFGGTPTTSSSSLFSPVKSEGSAFGSKASFGGSASTGAFGGAPIFGGGSSFGSPPAFGGGSVFGGAASSPGFGGSPSVGSPNPAFGAGGGSSFGGSSTFGSVASNTGPGTTGFGQLAQKSPTNQTGSSFGGSSFSSWR